MIYLITGGERSGKVAVLAKELSQNQCMLLQQENGMVTFKKDRPPSKDRDDRWIEKEKHLSEINFLEM
jgi:hypothetical protein